MKFKFLTAIFSVLLVTGVTFAQVSGSFEANDKSVSVTSDRGSILINEDGVAIDSNEYGSGTCVINGKRMPCDQMMNQVGDAAKDVGAFLLPVLVMFFIFGLISLFFFIFWIITLVHAIDKPIQNKGLWIVAMILTGALGSIFYYFLEMRPYNRRLLRTQSTAPQTTNSVPVVEE